MGADEPDEEELRRRLLEYRALRDAAGRAGRARRRRADDAPRAARVGPARRAGRAAAARRAGRRARDARRDPGAGAAAAGGRGRARSRSASRSPSCARRWPAAAACCSRRSSRAAARGPRRRSPSSPPSSSSAVAQVTRRAARAVRADRHRETTGRDRMTDDLGAFYEALLFIAERPLTTAEIAELAERAARCQAEGALAALAERLDEDGRGHAPPAQRRRLAARHRAGGRGAAGRLRRARGGAPLARRARGAGGDRLPPAVHARRRRARARRRLRLRASARSCIVAWSSRSGGATRPGRPVLFGTTFTFLERFGLTSLDDLPPLSSERRARHARRRWPSAGSRPMAGERLQKLLARGRASRRAAARSSSSPTAGSRSTAGAAGLGDSADPAQPTRSSSTAARSAGRAGAVHLAVHKPRGFLSSAHDERGRRSVVSLVDAGGERLWPAGRLDVESEGLMILTNDGDWANRVLHPRYGDDARVRRARRPRTVTPRQLAPPAPGVELEDGPARLLVRAPRAAAAGGRRGAAPSAARGCASRSARVASARCAACSRSSGARRAPRAHAHRLPLARRPARGRVARAAAARGRRRWRASRGRR